GGQAPPPRRSPPARARRARAREEDHLGDGRAPDEEAARVLPPRAAPVHPARARRGGGQQHRGGGAAPTTRGGGAARGGAPRGRPRAYASGRPASRLARAWHDPHVPRLGGEPALEQHYGWH